MILYHNTSNENAISISKEGIKGGMRLHVYGKGSEAEGAGIWCVSKRGYGYGGATITFEVDENDRDLVKQNDTEYIMYKDIPTSDIIDIDLMISDIPCNYSRTDNVNSTVESDIPNAVKQWGKDKVLEVFERNPNHFAKPYNIEQLKQLIETGNKYCKGTITFTESKKIVESNNQSIIDEITKIVDTCKKYNIIKDLRRYTIPIMRDYQLRYNPTADSRRAPWVYLINEINSTNGELDSALEDFIDGFVREGNQCIKDNIKTENKIIESSQDRINEFIEKELNDGTSWDIDTKLDWLKDKMYKQIRLIGRKINNAKYDYERNNLKRKQDFCKEVLAEINNRLKETKLEEDLNDAYRLLRTYVKEEVPEYKGISNIEMTTTKRGEEALKFNFNGDRYLVLRYPKEKKRLAYYKNNENIRYANNIVEILDDNIKSKMTESKHKLEEVSRNELLAKSKAETITRYNKSAGYKGFSLVDIDTTAIKTRDVIIITNRVGDYYDTVELDDILYWVGLEVDEARDKKMTLETVRRALLGAMDGMNMKVDCNCGDFVYRFAYMATVLEYKYGKPENRPSNITNPNGYGAMCKHLISLLSNKSWVKQVATTLQQWIIDEIDWVRDFLKVSEEDFQLPDEYARYIGKHGAMKKVWDKIPDAEENAEEPEDDTEDTNEDALETDENNEATNDTPEKQTMNNQTNMPKSLRNNNQDEELEEK